MKARTTLVVLLALLLAGVALTARAQEEAAGPAKKMTLGDLIAVGGWAMWPLGACSFGLIAMVVINFRQIRQKRMIPPEPLAQLREAARARDLQKLWDVAHAAKSLFTNALAAGLRHVDPERPADSKPKVEEAIAQAVSREESRAGFWINILSLITAISPMIGLLGTVSGMIGAFQVIAAGGMGKPELLANDIGEALITTAVGLMIAIPSLFFYFLFRNMLNAILVQAEDQYSFILDHLTGLGIDVEAAPEAPAGKEPPAAGD